MAAIGQQFRRGAYDFAHQTFNRYIPKSQNKRRKSVINTSSLSAAFLLGDFQYGGLYGTENAEDQVTVGASRDSYTRVTPVFGAVKGAWERGYLGYANFGRILCRSRCLCWGHGRSVFIRAYSGNGAASQPLYKTKTGYYEILEVAATASQAQIKTAYYKQSFVYHPDRNAGSEAATLRFSEINEAYTVLGNKALRKKYDRGLLSQSDLIATARPSGKETTGSSAKQRTESRRSVMGTGSRGGVFDFDSFYKAHYSEQLQRVKDIQARKERLQKKQDTLVEQKLDRMLEFGVGLLVVLAVLILFSLKKS